MAKTVYLRERQQQQPEKEPIDTDSVMEFLKIAAAIVVIGLFCGACYYSVKKTREYFDAKFDSMAAKIIAAKISLNEKLKELEENQDTIKENQDTIKNDLRIINENLQSINDNINQRRF